MQHNTPILTLSGKPEKLLLANFLPRASVVHVAETTISNSRPYRAHCHDFFEFFLITRGTVIQYINGKTYLLGEKTLCLVRPADIHFFKKADNVPEISILNTAFPALLFREAAEFMGLEKLGTVAYTSLLTEPLLGGLYESLLCRIDRIRNESPLTFEQKRAFLRALLCEVLAIVDQENTVTTGAKAELPAWLAHAMEQMERKENYQEGLGRFIQLAGMTQEHLTRSMRKYTGRTPTEFINRTRLETAASLLRATNRQVIDVIYDCGFNNVSHFNRVFKKTYKVTPREYRKEKKKIFGTQGYPRKRFRWI